MSDKNNNTFVNHFFKYINTAVGRDKVNRFLQYLFKFFLAYSIKYNGSEEIIQWNRNVIKHIQLTRKFVRIGKPLEHLNVFYKTLTAKDSFSKYCILGRHMAYAIYLTFDMFIWIHRAGIMKYDNLKTISINAKTFWMIGIVFGILNEIYLLSLATGRIIALQSKNTLYLDGQPKKSYPEDVYYHRKLQLNQQRNHYFCLIQYFCDFFQPACALGLLFVDPIVLALMGVLSSILGARSQWIKVNYSSKK